MPTSHSISTHQLTPPDFSIITIHTGAGEPTDRLACAVASLSDQDGIKSEQIVQHLGGLTGLWNKLFKELNLSKRTQRYTLRLLEEKNSNFHDALARAITRASGAFIGFLQPDEQYLPGALIAVEKYFNAHPEVDVICTGAFLHEEETKKITPYPATPLSLEYFWTACPAVATGTFFVRASLLKNDFPLDAAHQELIYHAWLLRLLQSGKKIASLPLVTTIISSTSLKKNPRTATGATTAFASPPTLMKLLSPWWRCRHSCGTKKAKRQFSQTTPCLGYELSSLAERKKMLDF